MSIGVAPLKLLPRRTTGYCHVARVPNDARGVQGNGQSAATGSEERAVSVPVDLHAEYEHEPTNLLPSTERPPRLSWHLPTDRGVEQTAYRICVATDADALPGDGDVWDSGRLEPTDDDRIVVELSAGEYAFELDHLGES